MKPYLCPDCSHALVLHEIGEHGELTCCIEGCDCRDTRSPWQTAFIEQALLPGVALRLVVGGRRPKASDLPDVDVLRVVEALCLQADSWTNTTAVAFRFPQLPFKVVAAKLSKLLRRGLLTGCDCGCRGDWELTEAGRELAGIAEPWRENPMEHLP